MDKKIPISDETVYMNIGKALVSVQNVEFISKKIVEYLVEFDEKFFGLTTDEFLEKAPQIDKVDKLTLGTVLRLLNLNPKLSIKEDFNEYKNLRNSFIHNFWAEHLQIKSEKQKRNAIDFCYNVGRYSDKMRRFLEGFAYFLALRFVKDKYHLSSEIKKLEEDFKFFLNSLEKRTLHN